MLNITRRTMFAGLGTAGLASLGLATVGLATTPARAADGSVVKVELWDKGGSSMDKLGSEPMRGVAMPGAAMPNRAMGITATPATIKAGVVTFEAINTSKEMVHEMIVAALPATPKALPYIADERRVDEEKGEHLGEVSELAPNATGALRITLKPGKYLLYCNVPGHYALGMWTEITVTP
ncbi:MAG: hypothetical protein J0H91_06400 [Rhodospirillales bacterium]|nr:hypothetical protein [Rhodospirillales bacterium]